MSAYFITATGTGVGKTFTTCALLHAARAAGISARGLKPVISGWDENDPTSDIAMIQQAQGRTTETTSLYHFTAPLSPHRAALLEGKQIDPKALEAWCHARMVGDGLTLIEGAGGVMVPLTDSYTQLDFMAGLKLPVILVVGSYLGTISHTLTALEVLRTRGLRIAALVMNESENSSVTLAEAEAGLAPFIGDIPLRIVQPRVFSWKEAAAIHTLVETL